MSTFCLRVIKDRGKLVDSFVKLRVIITEEDVFVSWIDVVFDVSMLEDWLRFPTERND